MCTDMLVPHVIGGCYIYQVEMLQDYNEDMNNKIQYMKEINVCDFELLLVQNRKENI